MKTTQQTLGKKLGKIAFYIAEIISIILLLSLIIFMFIEKKINSGLFSNLLLFQGTVLGITWGAKASSNFAKPKIRDGEIK